MQYLYASEISDFEDTKQHYKNLSNSIHSIHDLYLLYISLLIEIFKKAVNKYKISNESVSGNISEIYSNENFPISGDNVIDIYKYRPINIKN